MRVLALTCVAIALVAAGLILHGKLERDRESREVKPFLTYTRLMGLARDSDEYFAKYHSWPQSIGQLYSLRPDFQEWATDMWGHACVIVPYSESEGYGRILSYGRDGKPGGKAEVDRDIEVHFPCAVNSNWNEKVGQSLKRPYLRVQ